MAKGAKMQAGDVVGHKFENGLGVILETPKQTNNGDYLVHFANAQKPKYCREKWLELVRL
tara:strand:- start:58 stop:237 length:180 start_codon:yes stop_codon:yes gene_type:complete